MLEQLGDMSGAEKAFRRALRLRHEVIESLSHISQSLNLSPDSAAQELSDLHEAQVALVRTQCDFGDFEIERANGKAEAYDQRALHMQAAGRTTGAAVRALRAAGLSAWTFLGRAGSAVGRAFPRLPVVPRRVLLALFCFAR